MSKSRLGVRDAAQHVLHEDEVVDLAEPVLESRVHAVPRLPVGSGPYRAPGRRRISEHGPHGPGTPIDQWLSSGPEAKRCGSSGDADGRPSPYLTASSSSWHTEAPRAGSSSSPQPPADCDEVSRSQATRDRALLEVVAEGEVAAHLEERWRAGWSCRRPRYRGCERTFCTLTAREGAGSSPRK